MKCTTTMKQIILLLLGFILTTGVFGQEHTKIGDIKATSLSGDIMVKATDYLVLEMNYEQVERFLKEKVKEIDNLEQMPIIDIPISENEVLQFRVRQTSAMHPDLQAQYPDIRSYAGYDINNPVNTIRFEIGERGFRAKIKRPGIGVFMIDPAHLDDKNVRMVYNRASVQKSDYKCLIDDSHIDINDNNDDLSFTAVNIGSNDHRKYRLALGCTREYSSAIGCATVACVLTEMNTAINRINGIYEKEFAVTLEIIPTNANVIYFSEPDGYTNNNGGTMLCENGQKMQSVIGSANYDIGHVFSTGGGGVAYLQGPCDDNNVPACVNSDYKAGGVTGLLTPTGDPFYVDFVAHEMGHQFGANHTQNNNCQRSTTQSYEPGSASTIMGYAGICPPNVQFSSDDYFHAASLIEVHNFLNSFWNSCPQVTALANNEPVITGTAATYDVPVSTPFRLEATASDADGDPLTYCWEQFDNEVSTQSPVATSTAGPNFRTFDPTTDNTRYFPNLPAIISGSSPTWEVLTSVTRTMNFKVTVRDNHPGEPAGTSFSGRLVQEDVVLNFTATAGPFTVTSPNGAVTWTGAASETVTWDVANTTAAPVSCANVDIFLSTDGGATFGTTLATSVPNNGSASITVPNVDVAGGNGIIMVKCSDNVFLNVGGSITINSAVLPVEFTSFTTTTKNCGVLLEWSTASEEDNSHFEVLRSGDGLAYEKVGEVAGEGTTSETQHYSFNDEPGQGRWFYKLRQVDFDGTAEYSDVVEATTDCGNAFTQIRPNPAANNALLVFTAKETGTAIIGIYDVIGQQIAKDEVTVLKDERISYELPVSRLAKGVYVVRISHQRSTETVRMIKQ